MAMPKQLQWRKATGTRPVCKPAQRQRLVLPVCRAQAEAHTAMQHHTSRGREVQVELTNTSFSSRKLNATVSIGAPLDIVWAALTDYDNLGTFIPGLVENRCLERRPAGCILYQVGAQDVAMGVKFSAACTLEIQEFPSGIPESLCTTEGDWDRYFPCPASSSSSRRGPGSASFKDISFSLLEGDFQAFKGIWRLQPGSAGEGSTQLQYSLFVKPHAWLPVGLIQNRISSEVVNNLKAVRRHSERVHRHLLQGMLSESLSSSASSATSSSVASSAVSTSSGSTGTDTEDSSADAAAANTQQL